MNPITILAIATVLIAAAPLSLATWHTWKIEHRRAQLHRGEDA